MRGSMLTKPHSRRWGSRTQHSLQPRPLWPPLGGAAGRAGLRIQSGTETDGTVGAEGGLPGTEPLPTHTPSAGGKAGG